MLARFQIHSRTQFEICGGYHWSRYTWLQNRSDQLAGALELNSEKVIIVNSHYRSPPRAGISMSDLTDDSRIAPDLTAERLSGLGRDGLIPYVAANMPSKR